jgi:dTDP-glucose 4,6-dehydratase
MNSSRNPLAQDLDHVLEHTELLWEAVRGERFFLTGGTGFVGSWLTESLLWANRRLNLGLSACLLTRNPNGFIARSPHLACDPATVLLTGDAGTFDFPTGTFSFVVHAATDRCVAPAPGRPAETLDRNIAATHRVLDFTRASRASRMLFTSSGAVYGKQPPEVSNVREDYCGAPGPMDSNSAYGQSKRISEFLCAAYARVYGFDALIARLFAFVGPYLPLDENYAVGNFIGDALKGGPIQIAGDGTPLRSYLYAADLAIWLWTILFRGKSCAPYNVGSGEEISIRDLARSVVTAVAAGASVKVAQQPAPGVPAARYVPSVERAEETLGLRVWVPLEAGIQRTYDWWAGAREEAGVPA